MSDAARPDRLRPDDLLAHADWARELAAHLVRDPATADDVAQEALVAAIEKPPRADRPLRPWLAAVIRNLALARRRGDGRRARREDVVGAAAASRSAPSPAEVTARLDAHRVLAETVADLPEPLRATVYLRYYEGLDSTEIARRHGVAAETVRWRLAKALADLRSRLDARSPGGRDEWLAALAPIAALRPAPPVPLPTPAAPAAAVLSGVLAMATMTKILLGGAVVALLALFWTAETVRVPGPPDHTAAAPAVGTTPSGSARTERREASAKPPRRHAEAEPAASAPEETAKAAPARVPADARPRLVEVRARVLDAAGAAAAGARVECGNSATPAGADADADGRASFALSVGADAVSFDFVASAARCATRIVPGAPPHDGLVLDLGDVRLGPGGAVAGRVIDAAGAAVAGASVAVASTASDGSTIVDAAPVAGSGADGRFVLRGVPVGTTALSAGHAGFDSRTAAVEVRAGEQSDGVVIVLERVDPSVRVRGVVQTPGGAASPRAVVTYRCAGNGSVSSGTVSADADGRFDIEGGRSGAWQLTARDDGGRWSASPTVEARSGADGIVLRLTETRWTEVRVTRGDGRPAERYSVLLQAPDGLVLDRLGEDARADGVVRIKLPAQPFLVTATAPGCAVATAGPIDPSKADARIELRAPTLPGLRGRVTAAGAPVPKARVTLRKVVAAGMREIRNGFACLTSAQFVEGADTDPDGAFDVTLREAGRYVLRAEAPDFAAAEAGPFDLTPDVGRAGIAIAMTKGGAIEGRVLVGDGRTADGVIVGASRGDGEAQTVRTGPDGAFRFDRLTPGQWLVRQADREIRPGTATVMCTVGEARFDWSCRLDDGAATHFDLDLRTQAGTAVRGEVRVDGSPAAGWKVTLLAGAGLLNAEETASAAVPESGAFRFVAPRAGDYLVCAKSPKGLHCFAPVKVAAADAQVAIEFATGQVSVHGAASGNPLVLLWEGAAGRCALAEAAIDAKGDCEPRPFPAGSVRLVRATAGEMDPRRWPTVAEGALPAGGSLTLEAAGK